MSVFHMRATKLRAFLSAWTACFAVLLASLAPTLSHFIAASALANATAEQSAPIFGASHAHHKMTSHPADVNGVQVAAKAAHSHGSTSHSPALHFEHCPFCYTHAGSFGLTPVVFLPLPTVKNAPIAPALFYLWPGRAFIWTAAQARAPPAIS